MYRHAHKRVIRNTPASNRSTAGVTRRPLTYYVIHARRPRYHHAYQSMTDNAVLQAASYTAVS